MSGVTNVQLMVSTMNRKDINWFSELHANSDAVVINQCGKTNKTEMVLGSNIVYWIDSDQIGLSKSRNMAIDNSKGKYLVLTDDDLVYIKGYEKKIEEAFLNHSSADIIAFQVEGIERKFKKYPLKEKKIRYLSSLHISSVEIVIKRESLVKHGIRFQEEFGAGAQYSMGEENIFLFDCLKSGMTIEYVPVVIAKLHTEGSTWFRGFNEKYFYDRGAISYKMYGDFWGIIMILAFSIKKYNQYKTTMSLVRGMKLMLRGYGEYKKSNRGRNMKERIK